MAGDPMPARALSPPSRHVAAADSRARRVDRGPRVALQPVESKRFRPGRRMAAGDAAAPRPLSIAGDIRGAKTVLSKMLKTLIDPNVASDALSRLATGGSFAVRQLYTECCFKRRARCW